MDPSPNGFGLNKKEQREPGPRADKSRQTMKTLRSLTIILSLVGFMASVTLVQAGDTDAPKKLPKCCEQAKKDGKPCPKCTKKDGKKDEKK